MKKRFLLTSATVILLASFLFRDQIQEKVLIAETNITNKSVIEKIERSEANSAYLNVPFICQAPLETVANWKLHEESCEEAALLQAYLYETKSTQTKEEANKTILDMIEWEKANFGSHKDLHGEEMVQFITGYYHLKAENVQLIENASIKDIKNQIKAGHPVIVPITGEILRNPYYPYPGYHMLTVIGFTEDHIITNDNGTRRGANFSYEQTLFEKAFKDAGSEIIVLKLNKN